MVHYASARLAMNSALSNRIGGGKTFLEWSSLEREWLFQCLTDSPGHEHLPLELQDGGTVAQLKEHLRNRPDVPNGAFGAMATDSVDDGAVRQSSSTSKAPGDILDVDSVTAMKGEKEQLTSDQNTRDIDVEEGMRFDTQGLEEDLVNSKAELVDDEYVGNSQQKKSQARQGTLDVIFAEDDEFLSLELREGSTSREERAELTVQETVSVMLKATALNRLSRLKDEWKAATDVLHKRNLVNEDEEKALQRSHELSIYNSLSDDELKQMCASLGQKVTEAMTTARELTESANELNRRLLDYCAADGVEGRVNMQMREELAKALDEHLAALPPDSQRPKWSGARGDYVFGSDEYDAEIDPQFGGARPNRSPKQAAAKYPAVEEKETRIASGRGFEYDSIFE